MIPRVAAFALAGLVAGCNDPTNDLDDGTHRPAPVQPSTVPYPSGQQGVTKGDVIPNAKFEGFANAQASSDALQTITLGDFYNPHAGDASYQPASPDQDDRLHPPGSPYGAGQPKPTALLIDIASVWCGPCNQEAKSVLPGLYAKYHPCGGEFLFQLVQGPAPGTAATEANLRAWTKAYKVDYPATIDTTRQLGGLYSGDSFPDAAVVDTRTMTVVAVIQGVPDDAFWAAYTSQLDAACLAEQ
jgi:hypothetical protein